MAYTWVKLYLSILDDPRVSRLSERMFRTFIQFLLVAREYDHDGLLRPAPQLAWRLRTTKDYILRSLRTMSEVGLVAETPDGWLVVNFAREQAPIDGAERMRQSRERKKALSEDVTERNKECYAAAADPSASASASVSYSDSESESESESDSISDSDSEFDSEIDSESDSASQVDESVIKNPAKRFSRQERGILDETSGGREGGKNAVTGAASARARQGALPESFTAYEQNINRVTPLIAESLREMEREYSPPWVVAAIREAVRTNGHSLSYVDAILQRWKRDGFRSGKNTPRKRHGHRGAEVQRMVDEFMNS